MNVLRPWMSTQMLFYARGMCFQKSKSRNKTISALSDDNNSSGHHHEIIDLKGKKSRTREGE
jgi:hypothetical protein